MGLLWVDGSGTQFFSSLEPLSKEQAQRIKALQGESKGQLLGVLGVRSAVLRGHARTCDAPCRSAQVKAGAKNKRNEDGDATALAVPAP